MFEAIEYFFKIWGEILYTIAPFIKYLDPSLFQNITLGILAIYIPFLIVFLTDILNSENKNRGKFEKMVLNDEVFQAKRIFLLAIFGIVFFAFFSDGGKNSISVEIKILSILVAILIISAFWLFFKKLLEFSEGNKQTFELSFLNKLHGKNRDKTLTSWELFWSEKRYFREEKYIQVFINQIEYYIKKGKINYAAEIGKTLLNHLEKRDRYEISEILLPLSLNVSYKLSETHSIWIKKHDKYEKIRKKISIILPKKYFPTIHKLIKEPEYNWDYRFFGNDFFKKIVSNLLEDDTFLYTFFIEFKKHINLCIEEFNKNPSNTNLSRYITDIIGNFCEIFFKEIIEGEIDKFNFWDSCFPREWKILSENKQNRVTRIIFGELIKYIPNKLFLKNGDDKISDLLNGMFPDVDGDLFTSFLSLYHSSSIKDALNKNINFWIHGLSVSWSGEINEDEQTREKRISDLMKERQEYLENETIKIIFDFFQSWRIFFRGDEDFSKKELEEWKNYDDELRKKIISKIQISKLNNLKNELESDEIKDFCKNDELKELNRKSFTKLVEKLLEKLT